MAIIKKPYEISVWEDVLVYVGKKYIEDENGNYYKATDYIEVGRLFYDDFISNKTNYYYITGYTKLSDIGNEQEYKTEKNKYGNLYYYFDNEYRLSLKYISGTEYYKANWRQCKKTDALDENKTYGTAITSYKEIVNPNYTGTRYSLSDEDTGENIYEFGEINYQYYDERRIATIGSNTMTSPTRAINATLTRNINGTETLKFDMYYQYVDPITGERVHNPLVDLLVNERKVKLKYDNDDPNHTDGWYDFIVKKDDEHARDNKFSYTCTSLAVNELSKTGFNIELDVELSNNMGTVKQLAEKILKDSDWQVGNTQTLVQIVNEALYKIRIKSDIEANLYDTSNAKEIPAGSFIYVYYTPYNIREKNYFQFIYVENENNIETLSDRMTIKCDNINTFDCYMQNVEWEENKLNFQEDISEINFQVTNYRGDRRVRKQKTAYDPVLKQVVKEYKNKNNNRIVYGYQTTDYLDVKTITNYIHNSKNFAGTNYWTSYGTGNGETYIEKVVYPEISKDNALETRASYLKVKIGSNDKDEHNNTIYSYIKNDGIIYNYSKIKTFNQGEEYILRMKVKGLKVDKTNSDDDALTDYLYNGNNQNDFPFSCQIKKYENIDTLTNVDGTKYFQFNGTKAIRDGESDYAFIKAECLESVSWEELKKNLGIFFIKSAGYGKLNGEGNKIQAYYIEEIQLYKGIKDSEGNYMHIDDVPTANFLTLDHYFYKNANKGKTKAEDYTYITNLNYNKASNSGKLSEQEFTTLRDNGVTLYIRDNQADGDYISTTEWNENTIYYLISDFIPQYGSGNSEFEKVRSITAKESNKFNLIQQLCETFECWVKFIIEHNDNGGIKIAKDDNLYIPVEITKTEFDENKTEFYIYDQIENEYKNCTNSSVYDQNKKYFKLESRYRQKKYVKFYGETLTENFVGFKYGINLKDVTRTLDSDQIATKIIVKNNSQSAAKNGFCSIARAVDNPSKENFIFNFDYYTKQGIINKSILNNDLFMPNFRSGYIGLYPKLKKLNEERNTIIDVYTELGKRLPDYISDKETYNLDRTAAFENLEKLTNSKTGTIRQYSGYIYEDFYNQTSRKKIEKDGEKYVPAYNSQIYWIKNNGNDLKNIFVKTKTGSFVEVTWYYKKIDWNNIKITISKDSNNNLNIPIEDYNTSTKDEVITYTFNNKASKYYYLNNNYYHKCQNGDKINIGETYYDISFTNKSIYYIKADSNKFERITSALSKNNSYYLIYRTTNDNEKNEILNGNVLKSGIFLNTTSNIAYMEFNEDGESTAEVYIYGARKRLEDIGDFTVRDNAIIRYLESVSTLTKEKAEAEAKYTAVTRLLDTKQAEYDNYEVRLKDIAKATEEIENQFLHKYSRYIQEGSWIDENYMDDDLYYLDAVQVLYQSAYPKVSYNISVLELSALEGYEAYKFGIAHKTFIEDTEFFGWEDKAQHIPAREEVVITESIVSFDEPEKNTIKVQNYRTHFEDLFQRITASTQQLQLHSGEYGRAADAVTTDGAISTAVMSRTMAGASFVIQNANNQSVVIDDTGLTATKINDPAQVVVLTSGGLLVSTDGGLTWGVAITGYGINTNYLSAGTIDADNINIMSGAYPTFKWDGKGLRALSYTADENGILTSYDNSKYVTFDRFGIYGIDGIMDFTPQDPGEIENNANFALTWNGLFIRNSYRNGYVSISPTDDVTLYSYGQQNFEQTTIPTEDEINSGTKVRSDYYYIDDTNHNYTQWVNESYNFISSKTLYKKNNNGQYSGKVGVLRGKFGLIESNGDEEIYGLALYNQDGTLTFTSRSDGSLWLATKMEIGIPDRSTEIYLGVGDEATDAEKRFIYEKTTGRKLQPSDPLPSDYKEHGKKVIRVHGGAWEDTETETPVGGTSDIDRFTVYEDGFVIDNGNLHNGPICAPSGTIGGLSIAALPTAIGVRINSERGDTFKINSDGVVSPQQLVFSVKTTLENIRNIIWKIGVQSNNLSDVVWYSYINGKWKNGNIIIGGEDIGNVESNILYLNYKEELFSGGIMYVGLETEVSGNNIKDQITVKLSIDGSPNYSYSLVSSLGNIIEDSTLEVATNLIPYVYKNGVDISDSLYYKWYYKMNDMNDYEEMQLDVEGSGHHSGIGYILINNLPTDIPDNEHQKRYISLKLLDWDYISIYFEYSEIPSNEGGGN